MIDYKLWGELNGLDIYLFTIHNRNGHKIVLTNYGASVVEIVVPDKEGSLENVVLGFPTLEGYLRDRCFIGNTIGRFANRIANGTFKIDGIIYSLELNEKNHSNHSGRNGFNRRIFDFQIYDDAVKFSLLSIDGEGGFPGNLNVSITYCWNEYDELGIYYSAVADRKTIVNLTSHCYFNLSGGVRSILDHCMKIEACEIVEMDNQFISTGKLVSAGSKAFSQLKRIGSELKADKDLFLGLNDCYVLGEQNSNLPVCELIDQISGRTLTVFTSYPGLLVYTGDFLNTDFDGYLGRPYRPFDGICLECQFYPDSPNHNNFPSVIIEPGDVYENYIRYRFGVNCE